MSSDNGLVIITDFIPICEQVGIGISWFDEFDHTPSIQFSILSPLTLNPALHLTVTVDPCNCVLFGTSALSISIIQGDPE